MDEEKKHGKNRGGRPKKLVTKDQILALKCSLFERKAIEARARRVRLSVSEYLREIALTGKIDRREKTLPKDALAMVGIVNHLAGSLNQIAKKRSGEEELNALERANLKVQSAELKDLAEQIRNYLL